MKLRASLVSALVLVCVPCSGSAQEGKASKDPAAVEVLSWSAAALRASPGVVSSVMASGTYTVFGSDAAESYPLRVKALGFDTICWETDRPDGTTVTVIRRGAGWSQSGKGKTALSIGQIVGRRLEFLPVLAPMLSAYRPVTESCQSLTR